MITVVAITDQKQLEYKELLTETPANAGALLGKETNENSNS